ncbi:MAG TPA: vWA domain-containing protein, partial [Symbiobacteriaceae bacterium]|nr:vWA domain-containing protein [Symbiobacteriaceae bacterium]
MVAVPAEWRRRLLTAVVALLLLTLAVLPARAETTGARHADVVLLLDRSGSMAGNDPGGLTETGARVFLELLDPGDRVAIIAFDTGARTLLPLTQVGDGVAARKALDGMGRPVGEWTDIKAALAAALQQVGAASAERQPAVLLFTDGKPETQPGGVPDGYRAELMATATQLAGRSAPVFSIGLGQADFETLGQLAASTRAESFAARSSDQVVRLFSDVLSRIKERQVALSFSEELAPGAVGEAHTFVVPPYTRMLTLSGVGGTSGVTLSGQQPGGAPLDAAPGLKASRGANYTVYTIPNPAPGTWTVQLAGAGRVEAHAQLDSALRLELLEPQPYSRVPQQGTAPVEVAVAGDP